MQRWRYFAHHIVRCGAWGAALLVCLPWPLLVAPLAAGLFFAAFSLFHDATHGALGLSQRSNDLVLFATSAPLCMSAHAQRHLHLRHHARPLAADDLEGQGALVALSRAVLEAPAASARMRVCGFAIPNAGVRRWVIIENALNCTVVVAVLAFGGHGLHVALAVALVLHLSMNAWASHVPHRAPLWLLALASRLAWTRSPVVLSLVYHLEHHAHPRVPCAALAPDLDVSGALVAYDDARLKKLGWPALLPEARPRPR